MADTHMVVVATGGNTPQASIKTNHFEWIIDEPEIFGGQSTGPTPVDTMLASIAGCLIATGYWVSKEMEIEINGMKVAVDGCIDSSKFMGKPSGKRAGFQSIDVSITVNTDAEDAVLDTWLAQIMDRCPVIDNLVAPVTIQAKLDRHFP